ncbi:MAG: PD40 domain-containing protein [Mariniphaga sp.]|nr:PD40 domain-containing protein [Mariniphaga sp.]
MGRNFVLIFLVILIGCTHKAQKDFSVVDQYPTIYPDYSSITIPSNIAPLNFKIEEPGDSYFVKLIFKNAEEISQASSNGIIKFNVKKWKKLLHDNNGTNFTIDIYISNDGKWKKYKSISNSISNDPVDPFLAYRLLYPGYESWSEISIKQRCVENFKEYSLIENSIAEDNCVNCHSFNNGNPDKMMFHMRGSLGATYFVTEEGIQKFNLKTKEMKNGAVYPRWHPSGNFVAFSSNKIIQQFHAASEKNVEVTDLESSLILYDVEKNEISPMNFLNAENYMDTYPEWSPDGKTLFFCRAAQVAQEFNIQDIKYDLYKVSFNPVTKVFGDEELVFNADALSKSVSFPRVSPDGSFLVFTLHNYGAFPIWHKEADLYILDLNSGWVKNMDSNSELADSYHTWSSNGRWLVFSSKRDDELSARPYFTYISSSGKSSKAFVLPQKDPEFYRKFLKTYNVPELAIGKVELTPGSISRAIKSETINAEWAGQ